MAGAARSWKEGPRWGLAADPSLPVTWGRVPRSDEVVCSGTMPPGAKHLFCAIQTQPPCARKVGLRGGCGSGPWVWASTGHPHPGHPVPAQEQKRVSQGPGSCPTNHRTAVGLEAEQQTRTVGGAVVTSSLKGKPGPGEGHLCRRSCVWGGWGHLLRSWGASLLPK